MLRRILIGDRANINEWMSDNVKASFETYVTNEDALAVLDGRRNKFAKEELERLRDEFPDRISIIGTDAREVLEFIRKNCTNGYTKIVVMQLPGSLVTAIQKEFDVEESRSITIMSQNTGEMSDLAGSGAVLGEPVRDDRYGREMNSILDQDGFEKEDDEETENEDVSGNVPESELGDMMKEIESADASVPLPDGMKTDMPAPSQKIQGFANGLSEFEKPRKRKKKERKKGKSKSGSSAEAGKAGKIKEKPSEGKKKRPSEARPNGNAGNGANANVNGNANANANSNSSAENGTPSAPKDAESGSGNGQAPSESGSAKNAPVNARPGGVRAGQSIRTIIADQDEAARQEAIERSRRLRAAEREVFQTRKPQSSIEREFDPYEVSRVHTTDLLFNRIVNDINEKIPLIRYGAKRGSMTREDYLMFIVLLIKAKNPKDFIDSWNTQSGIQLQSLSDLSANELESLGMKPELAADAMNNRNMETFASLKKQAIHYMNVCDALYADDPNG